MGGANFRNILVGKDLAKEYARAVDQAAWEYGHGGYTGTIAEKCAFVNLGSLPPRLTVDRLEELIWKQTDWRFEVEGRKLLGLRPPAHPVPEAWRAFVEKAADIYDDKWGPALVVEVTGTAASKIKAQRGRAGTRDRVWVAMGMASE
jgi:hypothetical protein